MNKITLLHAKRELKERVAAPNAPIKKMFQQALADLPVELRTDFGSYKSVKPNLHVHARQHLPKCKTLAELAAILGQNTLHQEVRDLYGTVDGQPFFRQHFQVDRDQAVLFLNHDAVDGKRRVSPHDPMFVDGTFRTRPRFKEHPIAQVLIMFRLTNEKVS